MLAKMDASEKAQGMEVCQNDLVAVFEIVADNIRSGNLAGYQLVQEKSSGSQILYDVRERHSMKPIAALADQKVFPMPPSREPESFEAMMDLLKVSTRLREIASSVCPAVTPA